MRSRRYLQPTPPMEPIRRIVPIYLSKVENLTENNGSVRGGAISAGTALTVDTDTNIYRR